jgi:vancomycin permeability regulator SanA
MFASGSTIVMMLGICLALAFIVGSCYFVYKMFANDTKEILVRFILVIFTALVALFIVDKTIAWKVALMTVEQSNQLFDLIRTLVLMIFSYYFGTKERNNKIFRESR